MHLHASCSGVWVGVVLLVPVPKVLLPWAITTIYGPGFAQAAPICLVLVPGYLLRGLIQMLVAVLRGSGRPMGASAGQIAGLILLAVFLPIGVSVRGAIGAAAAVTASVFLTSIWLLITALRHMGPSRSLAVLLWRADFRLLLSWFARATTAPR